MPTMLISHPVCLEHDTGSYHPECSDRLRAILAALEGEAFSLLDRREAPKAEMVHLERVHPKDYIAGILKSAPSNGYLNLDPDTVMSPLSGEAALRAAGGVVAAVDAVAGGEVRNAFCAVRPPGHHAESARAMGFCLFNNVVVGARHAREAHGFRKVAVVDFDVHHGNGTQHLFWEDPDLFYASTHQYPCYPGTGAASDTGVAHNIVNAPLMAGSGSSEFRKAMTGKILPALRAFAPDFILVSAGFDAHAKDPLANLNLTEDDYAWVTRELLAVAAECCGNRLVSVLEGGYNLTALASSVAVHVKALMGS
ncbi:MAG: histone deacetylase family protein [Alphaproteobacteria bacterium]|nr:histone deacetylase family protein [Alphaproteobacteria bacterium]MBF0129392.1 histone deacetylase family protein [Alphaproteobacteria bacterium]